jgi:hypothetical protein
VRSRRATAAALILLPLLAGCGASGTEDYCSTVKDHQQELTRITTDGRPDSLLRALDIFRNLQADAPSDVSDEWQQVVARVEALDQALRAADVDPATYDRAHPPAGVDAQEKARIDAAARELGSGPTLRALEDLDQEARDVCHTPLSL